MHWIILFVAGILEICWAVGLKQTEGFTKFWPSVWTIGFMIASIVLLAMALRNLPVGTAYAIWTGIGAIGTALVGILYYREPADIARLVCLGLIFVGIVGLKLFTKTS